MTSRIHRALRSVNDRGASAVEYGLLVAAIAAVIVLSAFSFGHMINSTFGRTSDCIYSHGTGAPYPGCPVDPNNP